MKKIISAVFTFLILAIFATFLVACDGFDLNFEGAVWPFKDNADNEIKLNFETFKKEDFKGNFKCNFVETEGDETLLEYTITYLADKTGDIIKEKFTYSDKDSHYSILSLGEDTYYINEVTKNYTNDPTPEIYSEFYPVISAITKFSQYALFQLTDNQERIKWICKGKTEDVPITNSDGRIEDTIEFIYWDLEYESDDATTGTLYEYGERLTINFKKQITPQIALMLFETLSEAQPHSVTKSIKVFPLFDYSYIPTNDDFKLPNED